MLAGDFGSTLPSGEIRHHIIHETREGKVGTRSRQAFVRRKSLVCSWLPWRLKGKEPTAIWQDFGYPNSKWSRPPRTSLRLRFESRRSSLTSRESGRC